MTTCNAPEDDIVYIETKWYDDWIGDNVPDLAGKVAIVTGGYSGIGFWVSNALASKRCSVVMACRSVDEGNRAKERILANYPDARLDVIHIEHMALSSVRDFAKKFDSKYNRLDYLINNVGIMAQPLVTSKDGFEIQFQTNYLAHFLLTKLLWDKLVASPGQARVVTHSSLAHHFGGPIFDKNNMEYPSYSWGWFGFNVIGKYTLFPLMGFRQTDRWLRYGVSKLCGILMMRKLQDKIEAQCLTNNVIAVACHPGWASTRLHRDAADAMSDWKKMNELVAQSAADGSLPLLMATVSDKVNNGDYLGPSGWKELHGLPMKCKVRGNGNNKEMAKSLWEYSEECIGEKFQI